MRLVQVTPDDPRYPLALKQFLAADAPASLHALGNLDILHRRTLALFCSTRCPGDLILKIFDLAWHLRDAGITVIGGFHSPMERECLPILLRGQQPIIVCPARSLGKMRLRHEYKKPLAEGRVLFLSPFLSQPRIDAGAAQSRNRAVAALADAIFVAHAEPDSATERLCHEILHWQKRLYTMDDVANTNLISLGADPLRAENAAGFFKHHFPA